eukprot:EG_transcript_12688
MAAACLAQRWPLRALRWFSTPCVNLLPHRLPSTASGLQRSPWLALATVSTIALPPVTTAVGRGTLWRRRLPGDQCPAPNAEVQALFDQYGIDGQKVVQGHVAIANYDGQRVERMTSYLASLGVDVKCAVEKYPKVLVGRVEAYEEVVQLLRDHGVNITHAVGSQPAVLTRRGTMQLMVNAIVGCGHSVADVFRRDPSLLRASAARLSLTLQLLQSRPNESEDPRIMLLRSLGLDADVLMKRAPQLLVTSFDKMKAAVVYLEGLGVDVPKAVRLAPRVLIRRLETLEQHVHFLSVNGLDVLRHVNGCPTLFYLSIERKLQPTLTFVVEEMGRSKADMNGAYNLWTCSLEGRLRPRLLFLKSLGKSPTALSQFGSFSDQRFVATFARTDLQQYYDWRRQNGYPAPLGTVPAPPATSGTVHPTTLNEGAPR